MGSCCSTEVLCSFRVKRFQIDVRVVQANSFKLLVAFPQDDQHDAADLESLISNSALREGLIEGVALERLELSLEAPRKVASLALACLIVSSTQIRS